jgi:putative DNA primase/helicase
VNPPSRHSIEAEFQPLTEDDLRGFESSWITPELAEQAGAKRVDSPTGGLFVGRNGSGDYGGVVFPYFDPGQPSKPILYVLRRDKPDFETVDGKVKEKAKYLVAPGSPQRLYFPSWASEQMLSDVSLDLVPVEGEKKLIALGRLAWHGLGESAERPRFLPIGMRGVYGWRGKTGKETLPDGSSVQVKGVIADLQRITWRSRRIVNCFDINVLTNPQVKQAREDFTAEQERRGARVSWFEWPADTPASVNGVDDFLAIVGPDKVLKLIDAARPTKPTTKQQAECRREFEAIAEDRYRLSLPSIGLNSKSIG